MVGKRAAVLLIVVAAMALGGCGSDEAQPGFRYRIDPTILPSYAELPDGPRLAAVQVDGGRPALFIADELLVAPRDPAELDELLERTGGIVVSDNAVPPPPPGIDLRTDETAATEYVVRVDPSRLDLDGFATDAVAAGVTGSHAISSDAAARLLGLVVRQVAQGRPTRPNFAFAGDYLTSTREHPTTGGNVDAFGYSVFAAAGSGADVVDAWRLVAANPPPRRSRVAIIDDGFWLDAQGRPMSTGTGSDLPAQPAQWDFVENDSVAGGPNTSGCTGGSPCPWHGNSAAGAAVGILDNRYGAAGTGGQVADPILLRAGYSDGSTAAAVRVAVAWGADVISMSFGGECDNSFCDLYYESVGLYGELRNAHSNGVVMVAAAGNGADVGGGDFVGFDTHAVPCRSDHVICVGALGDGSTSGIRYSNFGPFVDIWAPTNLPVMPHGANAMVHRYGGTSAATPFVAGVAAILRAYDATLDSDSVNGFLYAAAGKNSADPHVVATIDAFEAVRLVAGTTPPEVTVVTPAPNAQVDILSLGGVEFRAETNDLEDGAGCCTVRWSSLLDGAMGEGPSIRYEFDSLGARLITAEVEDSEGGTSFVNFGVNVIEGAPTVVIDSPQFGDQLWEDTPTTLAGRDLGLGLCQADPTDGHWTSDNPNDEIPADGCTVIGVFHGEGLRLLTFSVTAPHGTAGSTAVWAEVDPKPPVVASLIAPSDGAAFNVDNGDQVMLEAYVEGSEPVVRAWTWLADGVGCEPFTIPAECSLLNPVCAMLPPEGVTDVAFWDLAAAPPPCTGTGRIVLEVTDALAQTASDDASVSLVLNPD